MKSFAKFTAAFALAILANTATVLKQSEGERDFIRYQARQGKNYQTLAEFELRLNQWQKTENLIKSKKNKSYTLSHNKFSDWTPEEREKLLGLNMKSMPKKQPAKRNYPDKNLEAFWIFGQCEPKQYKHWFLGCRDCQEGCDECEGRFIGRSKCVTCPEGVIDEENKCVPCDTDQYVMEQGESNVCESCSSNTPHCKTCNDFSGVCSACESPYTLNELKECSCPQEDQIDTGSTCVTARTCPSGEYADSTNVCQPCGTNCDECENVTGECTTCTTNYGLDLEDRQNCITCTVAIGFIEDLPATPFGCLAAAHSRTRAIPPYASSATSVDWRDFGVIRPINDQGQCGCCYAFSAVNSVESVNGIRTGEVYHLSKQHVVDCCTENQGCWGCDGGYLVEPVEDFLVTEGTYLEDDYPYTSGDSEVPGANCLSQSYTVVDTNDVAVTGVRYATNDDSQSQADFLKALRDQPLNVAFEVTDSFNFYSSGIFTGEDCATGQPQQNHAVQAVGYGTAGGVQYAILRNQWGTTWGDEGYMKVALDNSVYGPCGLFQVALLTQVGASDIAAFGY